MLSGLWLISRTSNCGFEGRRPAATGSRRSTTSRCASTAPASGSVNRRSTSMRSIPPIPEQYGKALGRQLANPTVFRALDQAGLSRGERIRLRLVLDDDKTAPHSIRWERLWLPIAGDDWRIAVHPRVAFSRYIAVQSPDDDPPDALAFRLLFAVANPCRPGGRTSRSTSKPKSRSSSRSSKTDRSIAACRSRCCRAAPGSARRSRRGWPHRTGRSCRDRPRCRTSPTACIRSITASISWRTATTARTTASARCCWRTRAAARRRSTTPSCSRG